MSDQPPSSSGPDNKDCRELRHKERANRRAERRALGGYGTSGWIGGLTLILIGAVFLLQNLSGIRLNNWWALFILIPAIGGFTFAWNSYKKEGRLSGRARGSLISGFGLLILTAAFIFNLNFGYFWPVFLILAGLAVLVNVLAPR